MTMIDQHFDRTYQAAREDMNRAIADGLRMIGRDVLRAFETLDRIQFASPWTQQPRKTARH
jgi:hypothetical protein